MSEPYCSTHDWALGRCLEMSARDCGSFPCFHYRALLRTSLNSPSCAIATQWLEMAKRVDVCISHRNLRGGAWNPTRVRDSNSLAAPPPRTLTSKNRRCIPDQVSPLRHIPELSWRLTCVALLCQLPKNPEAEYQVLLMAARWVNT